jgi:hypothetical protein
MNYSTTWELSQNESKLPIIFVKRKDAVQYANENLVGEYLLVKDTCSLNQTAYEQSLIAEPVI